VGVQSRAVGLDKAAEGILVATAGGFEELLLGHGRIRGEHPSEIQTAGAAQIHRGPPITLARRRRS
jgi:hypothetical protein